jgi:hypothetical protein
MTSITTHEGVQVSHQVPDSFDQVWHLFPNKGKRSKVALPSEPLKFWYTNHRGERSFREVYPKGVWFGDNDWYKATWIMLAYDYVKGEDREFDMARMVVASPSPTADKFHIGDIVRKKKGYTFEGPVVSVFKKTDGKTRYVVEDDRGILHIFNGDQLSAIKSVYANVGKSTEPFHPSEIDTVED